MQNQFFPSIQEIEFLKQIALLRLMDNLFSGSVSTDYLGLITSPCATLIE